MALQCPDIFDSVEIPHAKEYHPAPPAALAPAPGVPSTPIVDKALEPIPHPATSAPVASASNAQPPLHPFSGIPNHYVPLNTCNFATPAKCQDGSYRMMPQIYDIEQTKAVFDCVLQTKVTVSVDIHNQFCNAITSKCNLAPNVTS
ncbi:hypothetical protein H2248_010530 [Termitomyces sp. 'cryptogamus']|nr:hypothetical protein H2248_010530 [Termitomyces sp. 'cryptogamus']